MPIIASDNFTDTDGTTLQAHTPSGGGSWTKSLGGASENAGINDVNRLEAVNTGGALSSNYYHSAVPSSPEYDLQYTLRSDGQSGSATIGLMGRMSVSENTGYLYWPASTHILYRIEAGSATQIGSYAAQPLSGQVIRLEIKNGTKKVFVDGVERISTTDNVITAAGRGGISTYGNTGTNPAGIVDDWQMEEAGSAASPFYPLETTLYV